MNSARASIIDEMIPNIKFVKLTSSEKIFEKVLMKVRNEEVKALKKIHTMNSFINFIEMMMPILCSIASIAFYNISTGSILNVEDTYAIVSVLYISLTPFRNLTMIFDKLGYFLTSHKAFNFFINNVIEKNDNVLANFQEAVENFNERNFDTQFTTSGVNAICLKKCSFFVDFKTSKNILEVVRTKQFKVYEANDEETEEDDKFTSLAIDDIQESESRALAENSEGSSNKKENPFLKLIQKDHINKTGRLKRKIQQSKNKESSTSSQ